MPTKKKRKKRKRERERERETDTKKTREQDQPLQSGHVDVVTQHQWYDHSVCSQDVELWWQIAQHMKSVQPGDSSKLLPLYG
jgi:hypothetical protein